MKNQLETPVLVFGEALVDEFPEQNIIGGAPFNVARTLAHFGCAPLLISRIGSDENGTAIRNEMQASGLSQNGVQLDLLRPTGRVVVHMTDVQDLTSHRFEILASQAYDYIDSKLASLAAINFGFGAPERAATSTPLKGIIYFGTLAQRQTESRQALHALLTLLSDKTYVKYLDLNLRDGQVSAQTIDDALHLADIVKLNEDELLNVMHLMQSSLSKPSEKNVGPIDLNAQRESWQPAMAELMGHFNLQAMIVTLGARGYAYFDTSNNFYSSAQSAKPVAVVDTVGAGDAFSAVFLAGLIKGWTLPTSLRRAHDFAAAVCEIRGAVSPNPKFYRKCLQRWDAE